ncbi:MAG: hypothetical protein M3Q89_01165 [Verrucomicrobiota bacterium]|nr:hypothetical protein [Verrucomicrobiota bacterium]
MFPLNTKTFPSSAAELTTLLSDSIDCLFSGASTPVSIRDKAYPDLAELRISLDGAQLRPDAPAAPHPQGTNLAAIRVEELVLSAIGVSIGPGSGDVRLTARDVQLNQARTKDDEIVLVLRSAREGHIEITAEKETLESVVATLAKKEAGKQGVTIESARLTVRARGPRSVTAEVQLQARKLFFSTVVRIVADLDLDEQLNATLSGLACKGDGTIGALACGFLDPHLQNMNGRGFSLLALPLGEVRLRDVRLSAADKITVTAEFGA